MMTNHDEDLKQRLRLNSIEHLIRRPPKMVYNDRTQCMRQDYCQSVPQSTPSHCVVQWKRLLSMAVPQFRPSGASGITLSTARSTTHLCQHDEHVRCMLGVQQLWQQLESLHQAWKMPGALKRDYQSQQMYLLTTPSG